MFEFFFKYPIPVFTKGQFVLLGAWPGWVLLLLIVVSVAGLGWLIWSRLTAAAPKLRSWRAGVIWGLQSALVALVLLLLVGAGDDGGGADVAAEHYCGAGG